MAKPIELAPSEGITITIDDPYSLLRLMSDEDRINAIEALSCFDAVIEHVTNQIMSINGCTEDGSSGSSLCSVEKYAGGGTPLDKARYAVAISASDAAASMIAVQADEITRLKWELDELNKAIARGMYRPD